MSEREEIRFDKISASIYPGSDEPFVDFMKDGEDRGGWPPDYFRYMEAGGQVNENGDLEVGLVPIVGNTVYRGPMDETSLDLVEPYFDYILEPVGNGAVDGSTN